MTDPGAGFMRRTVRRAQKYGANNLDASPVAAAARWLSPGDDPRTKGTVAAIEMSAEDGFVARYNTGNAVDSLPGDEGAFVACSFWLADNYILQAADVDLFSDGRLRLGGGSAGTGWNMTVSKCPTLSPPRQAAGAAESPWCVSYGNSR